MIYFSGSGVGGGNHFQALNLHLIFPDNINIEILYRDIAAGKELPDKVAENLIKADEI